MLRQIDWIILLKFILNCIPVLIFALYFIWKPYLQSTEPFSKKSNVSRCSLAYTNVASEALVAGVSMVSIL